jgi:hypothetical protein
MERMERVEQLRELLALSPLQDDQQKRAVRIGGCYSRGKEDWKHACCTYETHVHATASEEGSWHA